MMWLKACPRCRGDLFLDGDAYGEFVSCIQCGHMLDKSQEGALVRATAPKLPVKAAVAVRAPQRVPARNAA